MEKTKWSENVILVDADYVDAGPWLEAIASLARAEALHADAAYETEAFSLAASLDFDVTTLSVRGEVDLAWGGITKRLTFACWRCFWGVRAQTHSE